MQFQRDWARRKKDRRPPWLETWWTQWRGQESGKEAGYCACKWQRSHPRRRCQRRARAKQSHLARPKDGEQKRRKLDAQDTIARGASIHESVTPAPDKRTATTLLEDTSCGGGLDALRKCEPSERGIELNTLQNMYHAACGDKQGRQEARLLLTIHYLTIYYQLLLIMNNPVKKLGNLKPLRHPPTILRHHFYYTNLRQDV